jgi:phospholipid/cholesterol/gamma-HCH transport system permease protein
VNPLKPLERVGRWIAASLADVGEFSYFTMQVARWIFMGKLKWRLLGPQMFEVGVLSIPVIVITGAFVGMVLAAQTYPNFEAIGLGDRSGSVINIAVLKEIGPVLAAVMLAGRVGGALAAELGPMKVTEQIDAMRAFGADPIKHLVVPRFRACCWVAVRVSCSGT